MKKLISIGVALALLAMAVLPVGVAAETPPNPVTYSKTPFAILGGGIILMGRILGDLDSILAEMKVALPFSLGLLTPITDRVGRAVWVNLAWLTDMTAWSMVLTGDVLQKGDAILKDMGVELPFGLASVSEMLYIASARMWDPWSDPTYEYLLPDIVIGEYPPTLTVADGEPGP